MANPIGYMLGRSSSNAANTAKLYAELQGPAQREASLKSQNEALNRAIYVDEVVGTDKTGYPIGSSTQVPSPEQNFSAVARTANTLARRQTMDPAELVAMYSRSVNDQDIDVYRNATNGYINPAAGGAYDTSPQFDVMGRQVAGTGSRPPSKQTRGDAMMYDLSHGAAAQRQNYNDARDKRITSAQYIQNNIDNAFYQQKQQQELSLYHKTGESVQASDGTWGYFDNFGNYIHNPTGSGTGAHNAPTWQTYAAIDDRNNAYNEAKLRADVAAVFAANSKMSAGFFSASGSNDSPKSFPVGFRFGY